MGGEEKGREEETVLAILVRYRGKGLERQLCSLLRGRGLKKSGKEKLSLLLKAAAITAEFLSLLHYSRLSTVVSFSL